MFLPGPEDCRVQQGYQEHEQHADEDPHDAHGHGPLDVATPNQSQPGADSAVEVIQVVPLNMYVLVWVYSL